MVTITSASEGKCVFCCTQTEGVTADFKDGLKGFLCWKDFRAAVKARTPKKEEKDGTPADRPGSRGAA